MQIQTNPVLNQLFQPLILFCKWLGRTNPTLLVKIRYFFRFKKFLNLDNPQTLNEKILYQSLKTEIGLRTKLTDKWRVREYIEECGLSDILVKLYGVWVTYLFVQAILTVVAFILIKTDKNKIQNLTSNNN